jgi:hypothetical protein
MHLVAMPTMPPDFGEQWPFATTAPVYMNLAEFHCVSPQHPALVGGADDGFDDGVRNAWFPEGATFHESSRGAEVRTCGHDFKYERFVPGQKNSHDPQTCTLCSGSWADGELMGEDAMDEEGEMSEDVDMDSEDEEDEADGTPRPTSRVPRYRNPGVLPNETGNAGMVELDGYSDVYDDELDPPQPECKGVNDVIFLGNVSLRSIVSHHPASDRPSDTPRLKCVTGKRGISTITTDA